MNAESLDLTPVSENSSLLDSLDASQRDRLTALLDVYLQALEQGVPTSTERMLADNPDLAVPLTLYLESLNQLHDVAGGFGDATRTAAKSVVPSDDSAKRLGDFMLGREIGRGGMGVVYEATQTSLGRRVALKVLPFASVLDSRQIARFKNEAQAAAQLQHPHIVSAFAIGDERGVHYYAMQFIEGESLDRSLLALRASQVATAAKSNSYLLGQARSPAGYYAAIAKLGVQAAEALHAAHEQGIVHRDIKPSNLLVDEAGKLWVADFGLARCQHQATLTRTGDLVGTLRYMSPEQATGKSSMVDHRTDIYSLAASLYELATLHPVFAEENQAALLRRIEQDEPRRPAQVRRGVPAALDNVIMKAMAKRRDDRYETAQQFADDLRCVLAGKPTQARPRRWADHLGTWLQYRQRLLLLTLVVSLVTILGVSTAAVMIAREKVRAEQNYERAERNRRQAMETVDLFGNQLADRLLDVPEASELRGELLEQTLAYYRNLSAETSSDSVPRLESATLHFKAGLLLEQLGRPRDAIAEYQFAMEMIGRLPSESSQEIEVLRQRALLLQHQASALQKAGQPLEARKQYQQAVRALHELVRQQPSDPTTNDLLAEVCLQSGRLEDELGSSAAEPLLKVALDLRAQTLRKNPGNVLTQRDSALAQAALATHLLRSDPDQSIKLYHSSIATLQDVVQAESKNATWRSELAATRTSLSIAERKQQNLAAAALALNDALREQRDLVTAFPYRLTFQRELAVSENNLGLLHAAQLQWPEAESAFRAAIARQVLLLKAYPADLDLQSSLGSYYNNLGIAQEQLNQSQEAEASFKQAAAAQRVAWLAAPAVPSYQHLLSKHWYNQSRMLRALQRSDEALKVVLERKQLWADDPDRLFGVAKELALMADQSNDPFRCRQLAKDTLREAVALGLRLPDDFSWDRVSNDERGESL